MQINKRRLTFNTLFKDIKILCLTFAMRTIYIHFKLFFYEKGRIKKQKRTSSEGNVRREKRSSKK